MRLGRHFQSASPRVWARAAQAYGPGLLLCALVYKLRALLMVPLLAWMLLTTHPEWEHDLGVWAIGLSLFLTGLALRIWSQRHLQYRIHPEGAELATAGPYAHVRNPVYLGNIALLVALTVLCELCWMVPITLLWTATVYGLAVRFEEARLLRTFGQAYQAYRQQVPRWIPRGISRAIPRGGRCASLARTLAVEYHCLLLLLLPLAKELYFDGLLTYPCLTLGRTLGFSVRQGSLSAASPLALFLLAVCVARAAVAAGAMPASERPLSPPPLHRLDESHLLVSNDTSA